MKLRRWSARVLLCLSMLLLGARAGLSEELQPLEPAWLMEMYADGWQKVDEGVLQRDSSGGGLETYAYGSDGLEWIAQVYEQQVQFLEDRYSALPSEELAEAIERLKGRIVRLYQEALAAPAAESFAGEELTDCPPVVGHAQADPVESPRGITATASVSYDGCGQVADIFLFAYADAMVGSEQITVIDSEELQESLIQASVSAGIDNASACYSQAIVDVSSNGSSLLLQSDEQYGCPLSLGVSVTGPAQVITSPCKDVTWTASASNGTPPYTYTWYINGVLQGATGPSLTKSYCGVDATVTVRVVVEDANSWTEEGSTTTVLRPFDPVVASISGPLTITTDYYDPNCPKVTWTASATGGHPGYTYSWYFGTSTTVQGTASTYWKYYCLGDPQPLTVKVTARDSDGHTDDEVRTTTVQHLDIIQVQIQGPSSVTTFTANPCVNVTWTAVPTSEGHSGFTYQWYIDSVLQGTSSSLTKQYCSTSRTVNVSVLVRASDRHGVTKGHTTTISHQP